MIEIKGKISSTEENNQILIDVSIEDTDRIARYLSTHKKETDFSIVLKKWYKRRTLSQNNLLHAIIAEISIASGTPPELIKEGLKDQYAVRIEVCVSGEFRMIPKPTKLCDTKEIALLIDGAVYEAAHIGVDLSKYIKDIERWKEKIYDELERDISIEEQE
jgi:hypothetical protein